jgi:hypothetical protein
MDINRCVVVRGDVRGKEEKPHGIHVLYEAPEAHSKWRLVLPGRFAPQDALRFRTSLGPKQDNNLGLLVHDRRGGTVTNNRREGGNVAQCVDAVSPSPA